MDTISIKFLFHHIFRYILLPSYNFAIKKFISPQSHNTSPQTDASEYFLVFCLLAFDCDMLYVTNVAC